MEQDVLHGVLKNIVSIVMNLICANAKRELTKEQNEKYSGELYNQLLLFILNTSKIVRDPNLSSGSSCGCELPPKSPSFIVPLKSSSLNEVPTKSPSLSEASPKPPSLSELPQKSSSSNEWPSEAAPPDLDKEDSLPKEVPPPDGDKENNLEDSETADITLKPQKVSFLENPQVFKSNENVGQPSVEAMKSADDVKIGIGKDKVLIISHGPDGEEQKILHHGDGSPIMITIVDQSNLDEKDKGAGADKKLDGSLTNVTSSCRCKIPAPENLNFIPNFELSNKDVQTDKSYTSKKSKACKCQKPKSASPSREQSAGDKYDYFKRLLPEKTESSVVKVDCFQIPEPPEITVSKCGEDEVETLCVCDYDDNDNDSDSSLEDVGEDQSYADKITHSFETISEQIKQLKCFMENSQRNSNVSSSSAKPSSCVCKNSSTKSVASNSVKPMTKSEYCAWKQKWTDRLAVAESGLDHLKKQICNISSVLQESIVENDNSEPDGQKCGCPSKDAKTKVQTLVCSELNEIKLEPVNKISSCLCKSIAMMPLEAVPTSAVELEQLCGQKSKKKQSCCC